MAPHATVINRKGNTGGAPAGAHCTAGATMVSSGRAAPSATGAPPTNAAVTSPSTTSPSADSNCSELM